MKISFVDRSRTLNHELKRFAERRLLFALSRFGEKIVAVSVVVTDTNGPRGGIDKACRITVKLRKIPNVTVTLTDTDLRRTLAAGADRVGHAVSRVIEKRRTVQRRQWLPIQSIR